VVVNIVGGISLRVNKTSNGFEARIESTGKPLLDSKFELTTQSDRQGTYSISSVLGKDTLDSTFQGIYTYTVPFPIGTNLDPVLNIIRRIATRRKSLF